MFELSDFYAYCNENDVDVIPYDGAPSAGITIRDAGQYAIFLDFSKMRSVRSLRGVCLHELGHVATGALHKICSPFELVERSEYRAKKWAAERFLTVEDFRSAFECGYTDLWQLAELFGLPEKDIEQAYRYWTESQGVHFNQL